MKNFLVLTRKKILVLVFALVLTGSVTGLYFFEKTHQERFFPNVMLGDELVGGKSFEEVVSRIKLVGEALKTNGLQLIIPTDYATTTIVIPEQSIGLTPDVVVEYFSLGDYQKAVQEAFDFGHSGSLWKRIGEQLSLLITNHSVPLPLSLRETAVKSLLAREFDEALRKPSDAHFIRSESGIVISPESSGEQVDINAVYSGIAEALTMMQTNRLQLTVIPQPPRITKKKLLPLLDFARAVSQQLTLALTYRETDVYASGMTLATWLTIKPEDAGVTLVVRRDKLSDFIRKTINERIDDAPKNSRFSMVSGKLLEITPGTSGSVASIEETASRIEEALNERYLTLLFPKNGESAKLPAEVIKMPVTFAQAQPKITAATVAQFNINDLVGTASTSFKGSTASRKHNIKKGVERVSGLLIAPGEEFSLVEALGEVSEETGFEKEYVIKGDRSVKEAGGGLCQLATTVFRAALNAGLPITERTNHSYVVGYYGPGLDATIYGPYPDLKFVNDTGEYLLFQMHTDGDRLSADFYGMKDNRKVAITAPKLFDYIDPPPDKYLPDPESLWGAVTCTDHARKGLTAEATYSVTYPDGKVKVQEFKSVYQPWPKICLVGIKIPQPAVFR
jgi:vancomycin resistance protein YoaR